MPPRLAQRGVKSGAENASKSVTSAAEARPLQNNPHKPSLHQHQPSRCRNSSQTGEGGSEGVIVSSRVQINDGAPIRVDWRLSPANHGDKVADVIVNGISTASTQHSDLVLVMQRHNGHLPSLLVALREKNASNGILRSLPGVSCDPRG
jgi:hypothetical protein